MIPEPNQPIIGFVAGTPILTPEGSKPIEQLRPGDLRKNKKNKGVGSRLTYGCHW